jgi:hypothetical protein
MRQALEGYIDHEEDIQNQLREYSRTGKPLSEWKRVFLMPDQLHPTRGNILNDSYTRGNFSDEWFTPNIIPGLEEAEEKNRNLTDTVIGGIELTPDTGHIKRTTQMKHLVNDSVLLSDIYKGLLKEFSISDKNSLEAYQGLLLQLEKHLEKNPEETCTVYIMSHESKDAEWLTRERSIGGQLYQGANPDKSGEFYPGDRNIGDQSRVVIQLHRLKILNPDRSVLANDIRFVAVRIPERMSASWLAQIQQKEEHAKSS